LPFCRLWRGGLLWPRESDCGTNGVEVTLRKVGFQQALSDCAAQNRVQPQQSLDFQRKRPFGLNTKEVSVLRSRGLGG